MSCNTNYASSRGICERFYKHNAFYTCNNSNKIRCRPVKKVIPSRSLETTYSDGVKSCSTGVINNIKKLQVTKPRKTTKSDLHFDSQRSAVDFCARCGDSKAETKGSLKTFQHQALDSLGNDIETQVSVDQQRIKNVHEKKKMIRQFYKNENFKPSSAFIKESNSKKNTLDPIKEAIEGKSSSEDATESATEHSDSIEEIGFLNVEDDKNIKDLKDFRKDNYFECHSSKARVFSKGSVTSLNGHKCVYRFYLNDRLFPVPLNRDHQNIIRCVECLLPLATDADENSINGTIQTKVKIDGEVQDLMLMLPVKKPLIIQEKRTMSSEKRNDVVYFGIVKLNCNGDSIFNTTNPYDSLALRYQKGYKEYLKNEKCLYEKVEEDNVIFI